MDSFMTSAGAARIKMNAAEKTVASTGCRCTTPAHRCAAGTRPTGPAGTAFWAERSRWPASVPVACLAVRTRPNTLPPRKVFSRDGRARR